MSKESKGQEMFDLNRKLFMAKAERVANNMGCTVIDYYQYDQSQKQIALLIVILTILSFTAGVVVFL